MGLAISAELLAGFTRSGAWSGRWRDGRRALSATFGANGAYTCKALMRRRLTGDAGINPNRGHNPRKRKRRRIPALRGAVMG